MKNVWFALTLVLLAASYTTADVMVYGQGDDATISRPYCST